MMRVTALLVTAVVAFSVLSLAAAAGSPQSTAATTTATDKKPVRSLPLGQHILATARTQGPLSADFLKKLRAGQVRDVKEHRQPVTAPPTPGIYWRADLYPSQGAVCSGATTASFYYRAGVCSNLQADNSSFFYSVTSAGLQAWIDFTTPTCSNATMSFPVAAQSGGCSNLTQIDLRATWPIDGTNLLQFNTGFPDNRTCGNSFLSIFLIANGACQAISPETASAYTATLSATSATLCVWPNAQCTNQSTCITGGNGQCVLTQNGTTLVQYMFTPPGSNGSNTGVIVGAVIGVLAAVGLGIGIFCWWRGKKQQQEQEDTMHMPLTSGD